MQGVIAKLYKEGELTLHYIEGVNEGEEQWYSKSVAQNTLLTPTKKIIFQYFKYYFYP